MNFKSRNFMYNGIENTEMGVLLVTLSAESLNSLGIYERTVLSDLYSSNNPMFSVEDSEPRDLVMELAYIDHNGQPLRWTEDKLIEVQEWLITDNFVPFIEENSEYTVYLMCTKIEQKMLLPSLQGVLECTFKLFSPYKYKSYTTLLTVSNATKSIVIDNPSFIPHRPIFKITNFGNESTVNKVNDFEITGLEYKETVIIDNLMATVVNNKGENRYSYCNRSWIELLKGFTTLNISGNCKVEVMCEFALLV